MKLRINCPPIDYYEIRVFINQSNKILMMKEEGQNTYVPSKYSKAFNNYSRTEIRFVIPILKCVARTCHIGFKYPVYKVLKAIAKIFLLNQVEAIFFAYMIRQTNWDIRDKLIIQNSENVRDVVCYMNDHPQYKSLILYLMLITYSLKFYLNDKNEELEREAIQICPNFKLIFESWAKKHSSLTKKINPKTLNKVYQDLYIKVRHEEADFCMLVDSILQISPAYNPQKSANDRRTDKKEQKKKMNQLPRQNPSKMVKQEHDSHLIENHPIFSSSRLYQMAGGINVNEVSNFQVFGQIQKSGINGTRFGGSVFGSSALLGVPNYTIKDEQEYCQQLNLGLQEGESEQNILLRDNGPQIPQTSIINLSRGISITENYLSLKNEQSDLR